MRHRFRLVVPRAPLPPPRPRSRSLLGTPHTLRPLVLRHRSAGWRAPLSRPRRPPRCCRSPHPRPGPRGRRRRETPVQPLRRAPPPPRLRLPLLLPYAHATAACQLSAGTARRWQRRVHFVARCRGPGKAPRKGRGGAHVVCPGSKRPFVRCPSPAAAALVPRAWPLPQRANSLPRPSMRSAWLQRLRRGSCLPSAAPAALCLALSLPLREQAARPASPRAVAAATASLRARRALTATARLPPPGLPPHCPPPLPPVTPRSRGAP